jgi:two-component SAPR family response regulator
MRNDRFQNFNRQRDIPLDLLITDIRLADAITGWDVAEAVRELRPNIGVIYASGNPNNAKRRVAESIFLSKPVTARELIFTARRLLSPGR